VLAGGSAPFCGDGAAGCPEYGFDCVWAGVRLLARSNNRPKAATASLLIGLRFEEIMIPLQFVEPADNPQLLASLRLDANTARPGCFGHS
jgi:hypothetical protein